MHAPDETGGETSLRFGGGFRYGAALPWKTDGRREAVVRWLMDGDAPNLDDVVGELINRPSWHRDAACRGMGTQTFFPNSGG